MTNNRATDERIAEIEAAAREAREVLERLESVCASKHGWSVTKTQQEQTKYLIAAASYLKAEREIVSRIETIVDKIRYACDPDIEEANIQALLEMFDPESGKALEQKP